MLLNGEIDIVFCAAHDSVVGGVYPSFYAFNQFVFLWSGTLFDSNAKYDLCVYLRAWAFANVCMLKTSTYGLDEKKSKRKEFYASNVRTSLNLLYCSLR